MPPGNKVVPLLSSSVLSRPKGQRGESRQAAAFLANVSCNILMLAGERVAATAIWLLRAMLLKGCLVSLTG